MADGVIPDGYIRDLANGAEIAPVSASLIFGRYHDAKTHLRKTTPRAFHNVALEQNALRVFQFKEILDNKWIPVCATHVSGFAFHPGQRLEYVIVAHLNIRGCSGGRSTAEHDVFSCRLKKVVDDFVRPRGPVAETSSDGLSVRASSGRRDAMEIRQVRIHDRYIGPPPEPNSPRGLILRSAVHPHSVKNEIINNTAIYHGRQRADNPRSGKSCDLQTHQAIVVCARRK